MLGWRLLKREEDVTQEDYDEVFDLNAWGQFFVAQQGLKHCAIDDRIILTSSVAASMAGVKIYAFYAGSKGAVVCFTRSFAVDCGSKRITVNAVARGGGESGQICSSSTVGIMRQAGRRIRAVMLPSRGWQGCVRSGGSGCRRMWREWWLSWLVRKASGLMGRCLGLPEARLLNGKHTRNEEKDEAAF